MEERVVVVQFVPGQRSHRGHALDEQGQGWRREEVTVSFCSQVDVCPHNHRNVVCVVFLMWP